MVKNVALFLIKGLTTYTRRPISCRAALGCTIHGPLDFRGIYRDYHFTNLNTNSNDTMHSAAQQGIEIPYTLGHVKNRGGKI
jgi:hypothetical protein